MADKKKLEVAEAVIAAVVEQMGVKGFAVVLNNVFVHGDIIKKMYGHCNQEALTMIYEGIDKINKAADKVE